MSDVHAPAPSGTFHHGDADAILRWCEATRFTGTLTVVADRVRAEIPLLSGTPEVTTAREGDDPVALAVDLFIRASEGSYTLAQQLPPISGATVHDPRKVSGDFALCSPADVMRYCEDAGLTGQLQLTLVDEPSRHCKALYERGELISLTLDGRDDLDVAAIFEWSHGSFEITAFSLFERDPNQRDPLLGAPPPPESGQLMKTVEMGLADLLSRRNQAPSTTPRKTSFRPREGLESVPAIPRSPRVPSLDSATLSGAHGGSADTTVKVYFVQARKPAAVPPGEGDKPASNKLADQLKAPERPRSAGELVGPARRSLAETALWVGVALAAVIGLVRLLGLLQRG
ncbi:MAG: hypothetical protein JNK72_17990 [Myxococcales bacterium]|nr:hypothetical protein [Myxococcales bacterium]